MMSLKSVGLAVALSVLVGLGFAQAASAQVRIDIPGRGGTDHEGPGAGEIISGLLALKGGYDRSRRGHICALAYDDANGDGARDRAESALPGWTFTISDASGRPVSQGVTDRKGRFCNDERLAPGAYTISETPGGGWANTDPGGATPWTRPVTLPADRSVVVLFGNCHGESCPPGPAPASGPRPPAGPVRPAPGPLPAAKFKARICVTKFEDTNGNGVRDGAEWVLASWQMTVRNSGGAVVATGWTNNDGEYCTPGTLTPGAYTVSETPKGGWITTSPGGVTRPVVLQMGQTWTWAFGNQRIPSTWVCVKKFNDLNGDGVRQSNEPGLPWTFTVNGPDGPLPDMITGSGGGACNSQPYSAGGYTITEVGKPGWAPTTPGGAVQTFTIVPTQGVSLQFGNRQVPATARVCVTKYHDLNNNGMRDAGEPLLPGWIFKVVNTAGAVVAFGSTNAQGHWCSTATLASGPATILETLKPGWLSTDPGGNSPNKPLTLVSGQTVNVAFGNRTPPPPPAVGQICVAKYYDLNSNGVYVSGEPLLPGWQFNISGPSGPVSLTTGATGTACTPVNLLLGSYVVTETMKPGWSSTAPGGLAPQRTVTVAAGPNGTGVMFGNINALPGQVCVNKYHDVNRNHQRDAGEPMLAGWTFEIRTSAGVLVASGVTDAQGRYCTATNLPPGAYNVAEVPQPWWVSTDPQGPPMSSPPYDKTAILTAVRGGEVHFGNIRSGRACVLKYNDLNGNGHRDVGEPPLAGVTFRFDYMSWGAAASVNLTTDASGGFCVDLPPGATQRATELPRAGWTNTDPGLVVLGQAHIEFTIVEGQTTQLVFGNHQDAPPATARVCVTKYNDLNGNGVRDAGEPPLAGWAFVIKDTAGMVIAFGTTNKEGRYCSEAKLPAGPVTVTETLLAGWVSTDPGGATPSKTATLSSGQTWTVAFGNRLSVPAPSGKLCVHKFNDLNGDASYTLNEPGLAGWQFTVTGPSGPITLTTGANGRACTNGDLVFGTYTITETPQAGWVSTLPGGAAPQQTGAVTAAGIPSFTFGNRLVPPPASPRLSISKSFDNTCASVQGVTNPCVFRIRILNVDTVAYAGPAAFSDTVGFMGGITVANSTVLTPPLPPGWSCSTSGPPISCSGSVNLTPGQFVDVILTVNLFHPVMPLKNCVSLTVPINAGPACVTF